VWGGWGGLVLCQPASSTPEAPVSPPLPPPPSIRFWGTPIPIWCSEDGEEVRVIGSIAELEEVAGRPVSQEQHE
jgi:hypothetical protein